MTPTPKRVTLDEADAALQTLAENAVALGDSALRCIGASHTLTTYIAQQRQAAASRRSDVEVVRAFVESRAGRTASMVRRALAALDRLAGEGEG